MGSEIKAKRKYNSSRRRAQARETHLRIVEAARRLFIERGYTGTTIEQIAQEAGVAVETVYATFGSKRALLSRLVGISVVGDDAPMPLLEREGPQAVRHALLEREGPQAVRQERDQHRQVAMFAHGICEIMERAGPVLGIMRTAAETEPDIRELLQRTLTQRMQGMLTFVQWLASNGPLRGDMSIEDAAETVWAVTSAEVHHLLIVDRGWPGERYEAWLRDTLTRLLLS